jgi:hypothetical protein
MPSIVLAHVAKIFEISNTIRPVSSTLCMCVAVPCGRGFPKGVHAWVERAPIIDRPRQRPLLCPDSEMEPHIPHALTHHTTPN